MKETFYFSHDYNAREDAKIQNMMCELGWEGYGLYWATIEKLAEAGGKLSLKDTKGIAFALRVEESKIVLLLNDFELFCKNDLEFWSNRLFEHIKKRDNLSKTRAKIGKIGGKANAKQLLSKSQANEKQIEAKESKIKESKIKENKVNISNLAVASEFPINEIIKLFGKVNTSFEKFYANKTQRSALERLVTKYGEKNVRGLIAYLPIMNEDKFAKGKSITPLEMENNLTHINNHYKQKLSSNKIITIPE
jgi:hypothetical protein